MFICWNVGGLLMEVHLQLHCFYIKFAIVNELPQKTNALTIVKKNINILYIVNNTKMLENYLWESHCK